MIQNQMSTETKPPKACPFCRASASSDGDHYVVAHSLDCFFAHHYAQEMWLIGPRQLKRWNTRAESRGVALLEEASEHLKDLLAEKERLTAELADAQAKLELREMDAANLRALVADFEVSNVGLRVELSEAQAKLAEAEKRNAEDLEKLAEAIKLGSEQAEQFDAKLAKAKAALTELGGAAFDALTWLNEGTRKSCKAETLNEVIDGLAIALAGAAALREMEGEG